MSVGGVCVQPCTILIDGKVEVAILAQCLEATDGPTSRGLHPTSMYNQGRIHSYLFNTAGVLLHANEAATNDWKARGNGCPAPSHAALNGIE